VTPAKSKRGSGSRSRPGKAKAGRPNAKRIDGRIRFLWIFGLLCFAVLGVRATALAVAPGKLVSLAHQEQQSDIALPATRGEILDRNGAPLAEDEQQQTVFATPYMLSDPGTAAAKLATLLHVPYDPLLRALSDKQSGFAYVARQIAPGLAAKAVRLGLPGVASYPEDKRIYPNKTLATQILGLVGSDGQGLAGIEYAENSKLSGKPGQETVITDPAGQVLHTVSSSPAQPGQNVDLTIDESIQLETEQILASTVAEYHALGATAIVENPSTGEIYAMANAPLVTTSAFANRPALTRNRAITDVYEPGSTFKVVTIAACLADGAVTPTTSFVLPPSIRVGGYVVHDSEVRPTERFTVTQILAKSSNVGVVTLAERYLGKDRLLHWTKRFGFGRPTGIDFPGEAAGLLPTQWSASTIGNVPFGQGIAVTPIQMAAVYSAIANGGVWVQPHLIAQIGTQPAVSSAKRRLVSPRVDKELTAMLSNVVADGTGTEAQIPGYVVAGKTGTAQKVLADGRGYSNTAFDASFVGFVPASHPQLCVLVMVDQPDVIYGGSVAAPAFRDIASYALQRLEIAP
jgi:cell division protein FtsI/penicillin-binding protein 2